MASATVRGFRGPAYRRVQRAILALCIVAAPLALASWFALCPQTSDPACPNVQDPAAAVAAFRGVDALHLRLFLIVSALAPYVAPVGHLGLGLVAMRRAPWLATLGILCGWVGSVPWGFTADSMFYFAAAVRLGQDAAFALLHSRQGLFAFPELIIVAGGWVIGHLLGYILLGAALLRARAAPRWAGWLIIAGAPLMGPIAYGAKIGWIQVAGYLAVLAGSAPAALAMLGSRDDSSTAPWETRP
jgi:hypothetical protein